ncbi:neurocan core protein-like [Nematostella vectensis]|uniref:neurocan core protein-like n=1 Tax=Nematostella vectensis TaxID=45351 RepID=UPI0020770F6A|nr:neurocan core protein-like [Nematostella vectensis]
MLVVAFHVFFLSAAFALHSITIQNHIGPGIPYQSLAVDWLACIIACEEDSECVSYNYLPASNGGNSCELSPCGIEHFESEKGLVFSPAAVFHQIRQYKDSRHCHKPKNTEDAVDLKCKLRNFPCCTNAHCVTSFDLTHAACECNVGFQGNPQTGCQDIDECTERRNSCRAGTTCKNTIGSYTCECPTGRYDNGQICSRCLEGWKIYQANHFCYKFVSEERPWTDASRYCQNIGGNLTSIHSAKENDFVSGLGEGNAYWIGLNDLKNEKAFVWSDGTSVDFTQWAFKKPSDNGKDKDCTYLFNQSKTWIDFSVANSYPFVCRYPLEPA